VPDPGRVVAGCPHRSGGDSRPRGGLCFAAQAVGGVSNQTLAGPEPDWNPTGHPEPPAGPECAAGTFGGPIDTRTTRRRLAGLRYNRFHLTALCSPTRTALLTGRNNRVVSSGSVGEFTSGFPEYTAMIPDECAPCRILAENGYSTAAFGKWHLTPDGQQDPAGPFGRWPNGWGFEGPAAPTGDWRRKGDRQNQVWRKLLQDHPLRGDG
jgi:Sulfatase